MSSRQLLSRTNCRLAVEHILELVLRLLKQHQDQDEVLGSRFFELCYLQLMYQYADFVQLLPDPELADGIPMLERGLARAAATMQWIYPQLDGLVRAHPELGGAHKLLYVVFSSALLYEIGVTEQERLLHLCHENGHYIKRWDPIMGSMPEGMHYKIRYRTGWIKTLKMPLTHVFAQQRMPHLGLLWISDSPAALDLWFKMMLDLQEGLFDYGLDFRRETLLEMMQTFLVHQEPCPRILPEETMLGELFWDWLRKAMHHKELLINQAEGHAHWLEEGLLLDAQRIFERFSESMKVQVNQQVLYRQFMALGLARAGMQEGLFEPYAAEYPAKIDRARARGLFGGQPKNMISGILLTQAQLLLGQHHARSEHVRPSAEQLSWLAALLARAEMMSERMQHFWSHGG